MLIALAFALGGVFALITSSSQTLWQMLVPVEHQGKVFSVRMVVAYGLTPLAVLGAVPVANLLARPILDTSVWAVAAWGNSQASAFGLTLSLMGASVIAATIALLCRGGFGFDAAADTRPSRPPMQS
jgi:hypothetical protein